ncbi:MAG: tetratricopeptide repeat protein, partial [Thiothrix litoralis]
SSPAVQALVKQADADVAKGNLDNAAGTLERALRIEADNPDLWMKLAKINEQQGKHDQAVSMVGKAQAYREQLN